MERESLLNYCVIPNEKPIVGKALGKLEFERTCNTLKFSCTSKPLPYYSLEVETTMLGSRNRSAVALALGVGSKING